jgi:hypothetical protein
MEEAQQFGWSLGGVFDALVHNECTLQLASTLTILPAGI